MHRAVNKWVLIGCWLTAVVTLEVWLLSFWTTPGTNESEPLFPGLGDYSRPITTSSSLAQRYFDQGLSFLYAYNQPESARSFVAAVATDPNCAMAYWGLAMALGPSFNKIPVSKAEAVFAHKALTRALQLSSTAGRPVEQKMIDALSKRFAIDPSGERRPLDEAYAEAMRQLFRQFPNDADIGALTAEALLELNPWDQWTLDGKPKSGTDEVIRVLKATLARAPHHPMALHLLIHTLEGSPHPEDADAAAEFLRTYAPGLEHLVHMPSHIDCRLGRWEEAIASNKKAIAAEKAYQTLAHRKVSFRIWPAHNYHVLAFAAMMQGREKEARAAIAELLASIPDDFIEQSGMLVDEFLSLPYEADLRFGRWHEMLAAPAPKPELFLSTALWHYGRGIAFTALHRMAEATGEQALFRAAAKATPSDYRARGTRIGKLLEIADHMLAGEIQYRQGKLVPALADLRAAVMIEDQLRYCKPPFWLVPARHALGATLTDSRCYTEAEAVYREDLRRHPCNGWSLFGLSSSLRAQKRTKEASEVATRFASAWRHADIKLSSSCFCLQHAN
jgi:tetratricopeptide (TPR) repeat protein